MWLEYVVIQLVCNDLFVGFQTIIIYPSELIHSFRNKPSFNMAFAKDLGVDRSERLLYQCICFCCCCTVWWYFCQCSILLLSKKEKKHGSYPVATIRIGVSLMEFVFLILYGERGYYLMDYDKEFIVFIVSIICWFVYSKYLFLFPNFFLPFGVSSRSKYGLAYLNGELEQLKRIKLSKFAYQVSKLNLQDLKAAGGKNQAIYYEKRDF